MDKLGSIKATALNKGKPRVWLERDLSAYGFRRGTPVNIMVLTDCIIIDANESGTRKMAGRNKPKGGEVHILDITCSPEARESIRMGCAKFKVEAEQGRIVISADFDTLGKG
jgi:hypothetical protein